MPSTAILHLRALLQSLRDAVTGTTLYGFVPASLEDDTYPLNLDATLQRPGRYYAPRDAQGLPMRRYASAGVQYSPTRMAAYGLAHFNRWKTCRKQAHRTAFLQVADWFMATPSACWAYMFDWNDLKAPWLSCMAQGEGISVLTRAFRMTGNGNYLDQAQRALRPLCSGEKGTSLRTTLEGGEPFLEEYPTPTPQHTLNGFLYALTGLMDLADIDGTAANTVDLPGLVGTLDRQWQAWDLGYWSAYDLHKNARAQRNPATVQYHRIHITLMHYLGHKTGAPGLRKGAQVWENYYASMGRRLRACGGKLRYRLVTPGAR